MSAVRLAIAGALGALVLAACGAAGGQSPTKPDPPIPVNLTVYINNSAISISPASVGAGPVVFLVTNQSSQAQALAISSASRRLATTAPISPQGATQVTVDIGPGSYTLATAPDGHTQAQRSVTSSISSASIRVGPRRKGSSSTLLQP